MIDIKITANRWADAASYVGMAREIAAVFKIKNIYKTPLSAKWKGKGELKVGVKKGCGCGKYTASLVFLEKVGKTPAWMVHVLETSGMRSINPIADITNYVALETGQPMHAFDAEKITSGIFVRKAANGEKMTTLDGKEIILSDKDTVITDKEKILAIAGIKGGKEAETTLKTKTVILEAANFDSVSTYKTSVRVGIKTDSSQRFIHGVSYNLMDIATDRAIELLAEICGGKLIERADIVTEKPKGKTAIKFDIERFNHLMGTEIKSKEAFDILKRLGFKEIKTSFFEVPWWRLDIERFEDFAEEVIRMYGLDKLISVPPTMSVMPINDDPMVAVKERAKRALTLLGYDEIYLYSLGAEENPAAEILNPMAEDKKWMRPSLLNGIEKACKENHRWFDEIKMFEIGKIFPKTGGEKWSLGICYGKRKEKNAHRELKGAVSNFIKQMGITDFDLVPEGNDSLSIKIDGERTGIIKIYGKGDLSMAEIDLEALYRHMEGEAEYEPVSSYPSIIRDISLWLNAGARVGDVMQAIELSKAENITDSDLIDQYEGENGMTAVTIRIVFQSFDKTLSDAEADSEMAKIIKILSGKNNVEIRK